MEGGKPGEASIEVAQGEVVLVEAKEVAQFVEIGGANLFGKDLRVSPGQVPKIPQIKEDAGRGIRGGGVGFETAGTFEKPEKVGLEALVENRLVGHILKEGHDVFRCRAEFGGKTSTDFFNAVRSELMPIGFQTF